MRAVLSGRLEVRLASGGGGAGADADLLITDILMPGINGRELATRSRARPGTHVLFISGYAGKDTRLHAGAARFLAKAFTPSALREQAQALLILSRELAARRVDVAAAGQPHGRAQAVLLERGLEGVDRSREDPS